MFFFFDQKVDNLSQQLTEQKTKVEFQESELSAKRKEVEDLKTEESKLESQLEEYRRETETASKNAGDTQLEMSQIKTKIMELEEYERIVSDAINDFDSALSAQDLVRISNLLPRTFTPPLIEGHTGANGFKAFESEPFGQNPKDVRDISDFTTDPFADEDPFKGKQRLILKFLHSFGHSFPTEDPFKDTDNDPFASTGFANFSSQEVSKDDPPFDPFGTGSFSASNKVSPFEYL